MLHEHLGAGNENGEHSPALDPQAGYPLAGAPGAKKAGTREVGVGAPTSGSVALPPGTRDRGWRATGYPVGGPKTEAPHDRVRRLDPRPKLVGAMALSVILFESGPFGLLLASFALVLVGIIARLSPVEVSRLSRPALPFVAIVFLLHFLSGQGEPLLSISLGPVHPTLPGLYAGLVLSWRLTLLLVVGACLTLTTPPGEVTVGMERLLRPLQVIRVPSQDLALMLSLALRFIPTISQEMRTLRDAQAARGGLLATGSLKERFRALCHLAVPLCLAVFRRADALVEAMEARGYDGGTRTSLRQLSLSRADWLVLLLSAVSIVAVFLV